MSDRGAVTHATKGSLAAYRRGDLLAGAPLCRFGASRASSHAVDFTGRHVTCKNCLRLMEKRSAESRARSTFRAKSASWFRRRGDVMRHRRHRSRRDSHRRPSKTREQWLASLRWNIKDAAEALKNAAEMGDMRGVRKYADQIERLSAKLHDAEWSRASKKRERRVYSHYVQHQSAGLRFGRGRLP